MSRTVTALFDSRAEAETARARFIAQVKTQSTRIIAKDTLAAVDSLDIDPKHANSYRDAIRQGCHLLVAETEAGQDPKWIIAMLEQSPRGATDAVEAPVPETPTYGFVGVTDQGPAEAAVAEPAVAQPAVAQPAVAQAPAVKPAVAVRVEEPKVPVREAPAPAPIARAPVQEAPSAPREDELRIGMPLKSRGGARVRSIIRETPAEEQVALSEEHVDVEHRASERRLSFDDVKAGGLLRERIFEIREMREEPVITKEAFVREEVIVRKTVQERTETVRDTVRRTDFEVDELPEREEASGSFFGGRPERR